MDTSDHMANKKCYISISKKPVATKLDMMVAQTQGAANLTVTCFFCSRGHVSSRDS